jgi:hypothetical protein
VRMFLMGRVGAHQTRETKTGKTLHITKVDDGNGNYVRVNSMEQFGEVGKEVRVKVDVKNDKHPSAHQPEVWFAGPVAA